MFELLCARGEAFHLLLPDLWNTAGGLLCPSGGRVDEEPFRSCIDDDIADEPTDSLQERKEHYVLSSCHQLLKTNPRIYRGRRLAR